MNTICRIFSTLLTLFIFSSTFQLETYSRALAQEECPQCLTATILPQAAITLRADKKESEQSFPGEPLEIAANPEKKSHLNFDLNRLPEGAQIYSWTLRLYLKKKKGDKIQFIRAFPVEDIAELPKSVATAEVNNRSTIVNVAPRKEINKKMGWIKDQKKRFALMLKSISPGQDYIFYSTTVYDDTCKIKLTEATEEFEEISCYNTQPKLIVKYDMDPAVSNSHWPQYNHNAQHTGRTPWRFNTWATEMAIETIYSPQGYIRGDPVMFDGNLFFHTQKDVSKNLEPADQCEDDPCPPALEDGQEGSGKFFITAVDGKGKPLWKQDRDIEAVAKFQPLVDGKGRLYVVTENTLHILDIKNNGSILKQDELKEILHTREEVSVRSTPTLGKNGALYLSTNRGIYALTPYPELKIWWKYTTSNNVFGRLSLSRDESMAYVVDASEENLVTIDNTDGTEKWSEPIVNSGGSEQCKPLKPDKFKQYPPVPVISKNGYVYLVTGYYSGNCLHVFNHQGEKKKTITTDDRLSQPVIGSDGKIYLIYKEAKSPHGELREYDPDGTGPSQASKDGLNPRSILVMDGNDRLYVIDRISDPQRVRAYYSQLDSPIDLRVQETVFSRKPISFFFRDNLLIAPDGTLYVRNDNHLFAVTPKDVPVEKLPLDKIQHQTTYLAKEYIQVGKITIGPIYDVILKSGGTIRFKPGFSVKKGAQLRCKIGL